MTPGTMGEQVQVGIAESVSELVSVDGCTDIMLNAAEARADPKQTA